MAATDASRTVGSALSDYLAGARLRSNAASVRAEYQRVADHLSAEIGAVRLDTLTRSWIRAQRDAWAALGHRAATIRLQVLKNALEPLMLDGELPAALFTGQQRVNRPHGRPEQNVAWRDEEVAVVLEHCLKRRQQGLARAVALARYAGLRRQTICAITESARMRRRSPNGAEERWLYFVSEKGEVKVEAPEDPRLTHFLDERAPSLGVGRSIAYSRRETAWAPRQLNQALDRIIEKLSVDGSVRPTLTLHGLRHARGVELAEQGASDAGLMAQLGHTDVQASRVYRRQALRATLAAQAQGLVNAMLQREARSL